MQTQPRFPAPRSIEDLLLRRVAFADRFSYEATVAPFFRDLLRTRALRRAPARHDRAA